MTNQQAEDKMRDEIARIAKLHMRIDTLSSRGIYALDFHELACWAIRAALEAAYKAGQIAQTETWRCCACGAITEDANGTRHSCPCDDK